MARDFAFFYLFFLRAFLKSSAADAGTTVALDDGSELEFAPWDTSTSWDIPRRDAALRLPHQVSSN